MKEKKVLKEIARIKDLIKSPLNEVSLMQLNKTDYSNLKYDKDGTQTDAVNQSLLDDINAAAKKAGITATITTAKTGHNTYTKGSKNVSRHMNGTGVDVAILNGVGAGGATNATNGNATFRDLGFKLKDALVSMGYIWNKESGQQKAVLWHTNIGGNHYNHLHISSTSDSPSSGVPETKSQDVPSTTGAKTQTDTEKKSETQDNQKQEKKGIDLFGLVQKLATGDPESLGKEITGQIFPFLTKEGYESVGRNTKKRGEELFVPSDSNTKIFSSVSGKVVNFKFLMGCSNKIAIRHQVGDETFFLVFCGIEKPLVSVGDTVSPQTAVGETKTDVTVSLYDKNNIKIDISYKKIEKKGEDEKKSEKYVDILPNYEDKKVSFLKPYEDKKVSLLPTYQDKKVKFFEPTKNVYKSFLPTYKESLLDDIEKIKKLLK
jgi:hypothetical protein